jgi:hypothetical protein
MNSAGTVTCYNHVLSQHNTALSIAPNRVGNTTSHPHDLGAGYGEKAAKGRSLTGGSGK